MTIVVGFNSGRYCIVSGDSRLTETEGGSSVDCCQKIFAIGKRAVVGFSGHLDAIADVLASLRHSHRAAPDDVSAQKLKATLPAALKSGWEGYCRGKGRNRVDLRFLIAGRTVCDSCQMFICRSPDFFPEEVPAGSYGVTGSGAQAVERCGDQLAVILRELETWLDTQGIPAPQALGWMMGNLLDSYLRKQGIVTVGRVFHTMLLDSTDAWCVPYQITQPGSSIAIGTRQGNGNSWVQYTSDGTEIPLLDPVDLIARWQTLPRLWNLSTRKS